MSIDLVLEERGVSRRHKAVVAAIVAVLVFDGVDLQLAALSAPTMMREWNLSPAAFGPALAAALLGMAVGTAAGGRLGDRRGRRRVLLGSVLLFGVMVMAAGASTGIVELAALRFVCGLGFGAAIPNAYVLVAELLPPGSRTKAMGLLGMATVAGGAVAAATALVVIPALGWRWMFLICGTPSLALLLVLVRTVPESPRFVLAREGSEAAARLLGRMTGRPVDPGELEQQDTKAPAAKAVRAPGGRLLTRPHLRLNLGLWTAFFAIFFANIAINSWLPSVLSRAGLSLTGSFGASMVFFLFAMAGAVSMGYLVAVFGSRPTLIGGVLLSVAAVGAMPLLVRLARSVPAMGGTGFLVLAGLAGLGMAVVNAGLSAVGTSAYPVESRATGLGVAMTSGRIASVAGALAGGAVLSMTRDDTAAFFAVIVAALVLCGLGILTVDRHLAPARTERGARGAAQRVTAGRARGNPTSG
ncbi:MFS transporter [Streptomyces sp. NPDC048278]|uniref:MFS transporter n=1 Tax=Streptomyces sp. NPDC048278 TaxID=3155809 RepID=UPI00341240A6